MRTALTRTLLISVLAAPAPAALCARALASSNPGGVSSSSAAAPALPRISRKAALATWFGPGFYGQRTACGQMLTPATLGLANRTLPCGTLVTVAYRGRRLTLPVIDRGPYANNAAWDLTTQAARVLGMTDTARIATRVVGIAPNTPALGAPPAPPAVPVLASTGGISAR